MRFNSTGTSFFEKRLLPCSCSCSVPGSGSCCAFVLVLVARVLVLVARVLVFALVLLFLFLLFVLLVLVLRAFPTHLLAISLTCSPCCRLGRRTDICNAHVHVID